MRVPFEPTIPGKENYPVDIFYSLYEITHER